MKYSSTNNQIDSVNQTKFQKSQTAMAEDKMIMSAINCQNPSIFYQKDIQSRKGYQKKQPFYIYEQKRRESLYHDFRNNNGRNNRYQQNVKSPFQQNMRQSNVRSYTSQQYNNRNFQQYNNGDDNSFSNSQERHRNKNDKHIYFPTPSIINNNNDGRYNKNFNQYQQKKYFTINPFSKVNKHYEYNFDNVSNSSSNRLKQMNSRITQTTNQIIKNGLVHSKSHKKYMAMKHPQPNSINPKAYIFYQSPKDSSTRYSRHNMQSSNARSRSTEGPNDRAQNKSANKCSDVKINYLSAYQNQHHLYSHSNFQQKSPSLLTQNKPQRDIYTPKLNEKLPYKYLYPPTVVNMNSQSNHSNMNKKYTNINNNNNPPISHMNNDSHKNSSSRKDITFSYINGSNIKNSNQQNSSRKHHWEQPQQNQKQDEFFLMNSQQQIKRGNASRQEDHSFKSTDLLLLKAGSYSNNQDPSSSIKQANLISSKYPAHSIQKSCKKNSSQQSLNEFGNNFKLFEKTRSESELQFFYNQIERKGKGNSSQQNQNYESQQNQNYRDFNCQNKQVLLSGQKNNYREQKDEFFDMSLSLPSQTHKSKPQVPQSSNTYKPTMKQTPDLKNSITYQMRQHQFTKQKPNIITNFMSQLKDKESQIIAPALIVFAVIVLILQLIS